ncbi:MAG: MEDS domain-containing protein, partial [Armatimonadota bacterium]
MSTMTGLQQTSGIFWGEIAPCEHLVQIYEEDGVFLDSLVGYVGGGLRADDAVVVIATPAHRDGLERRLAADGLDLAAARAQDRYIPLDAEETLAEFVVNGWPDEDRFNRLVSRLLTRARGPGRRVRAFGEMVAVLWWRGHTGATVRLEHLWHRLCEAEAYSLFCASPRVGHTEDMASSFREICATHTKV